LAGDDPGDDPYKYDWQPLHNQYGEEGYFGLPYTITISQPTVDVQLNPDPIVGTACENQKTITASLAMCGAGTTGTIDFNTTVGTFLESGTNTATVTTDTGGQATVTLVRPEACKFSQGEVSAAGKVALGTSEVSATSEVQAVWQSWKLDVTISPDWVVHGNPANVKAKLTLNDGTTPVAGQSVTLTTDHGAFDPHDPGNNQQYTAVTNPSGEISTTLTVSECPVTATVTGTVACAGGCTFTNSDALPVVCSVAEAKTLIIALDGTTSGSLVQQLAIVRFALVPGHKQDIVVPFIQEDQLCPEYVRTRFGN
jgi:hypothetical protein